MSLAIGQPAWIVLDGAVNARDVGGLPLLDGGSVASGVLLRSDNLQSLSAADVSEFERRGLNAIVDLRTHVEVTSEGPGPLIGRPGIAVHHLSLIPEAGWNTDASAVDTPVSVAVMNRLTADSALPTAAIPPTTPVARRPVEPRDGNPVVGYYLRYLQDRPEAIVSALRVIGTSPGAVLVHCAAGKDRTGVVVALALALAGVRREAIVEDYVATAERIDAILARLRRSPTYAADLDRRPADQHRPRAHTMSTFLASVDDELGGVPSWLEGNGWTQRDTDALVGRLRG